MVTQSSHALTVVMKVTTQAIVLTFRETGLCSNRLTFLVLTPTTGQTSLWLKPTDKTIGITNRPRQDGSKTQQIGRAHV